MQGLLIDISTILTISLMICKRYFFPINVAESKELSVFPFSKNDKIQGV